LPIDIVETLELCGRSTLSIRAYNIRPIGNQTFMVFMNF